MYDSQDTAPADVELQLRPGWSVEKDGDSKERAEEEQGWTVIAARRRRCQGDASRAG